MNGSRKEGVIDFFYAVMLVIGHSRCAWICTALCEWALTLHLYPSGCLL